jgi:hypothetical protein
MSALPTNSVVLTGVNSVICMASWTERQSKSHTETIRSSQSTRCETYLCKSIFHSIIYHDILAQNYQPDLGLHMYQFYLPFIYILLNLVKLSC